MFRHLVTLTIFLVLKYCSGYVCDNKDLQCNAWAKNWECYHNPNYMVNKCAKSCNTPAICGGNTTDTVENCWHRASAGYCEKTDIDPLVECNTTCRIRYETTCVTPTSVSHAYYTRRDSYRFMDRVTYSCDEGYERTSKNHLGKMICSDTGIWLPRKVEGWRKPTCVVISCGLPPMVNHTWMAYNGTTYMDTVMYGCEEGYYRTDGDTLRVCLGNKLWDGSDLICQKNTSSVATLAIVTPTKMVDSSEFVPSTALTTPMTTDSSWELNLPRMSTLEVGVSRMSTLVTEKIGLYQTSTLFDPKQHSSTSLDVIQGSDESVMADASIEILPTPIAHFVLTHSLSMGERYSTVSDLMEVVDVSRSVRESGVVFTANEPLPQTSGMEHFTGYVIHPTGYNIDTSFTRLWLDTSPLIEQTSVLLSSLYTTDISSETLQSTVVTAQSGDIEPSDTSPVYTEETPAITASQGTTAKPKCKCKTNCNSSSNPLASAFIHMSFDEIMTMTRTIKTFTPKAVEAKGAEYFGASAIAILGCIFGFIFLLDMVTLARHFKILRHNLNCVRGEEILTENDLWKT